MPEFPKVVEDLKRARDEIRLKIHLGSKELQDEWSELERRWETFESRAELDRSAKDVGDALKVLGSELKDAFQRVRKAL
jgi:DnaJ-domain-containing protein 1